MHPVGYLLIIIGAFIVSIGTVFSLFSQIPNTTTKKIYDNEQISFSPRRGTSTLKYILNLKSKSQVNIKLKPSVGPFDFLVEDFIGFPPSLGVDRKCITINKPHFEMTSLPNEGNNEATLNLEKGIYNIVFSSEGHIEPKTSLDVTVTQRLKPYEKLLEPGLQLLEVGFPILITGIVLFFGLQT